MPVRNGTVLLGASPAPHLRANRGSGQSITWTSTPLVHSSRGLHRVCGARVISEDVRRRLTEPGPGRAGQLWHATDDPFPDPLARQGPKSVHSIEGDNNPRFVIVHQCCNAFVNELAACRPAHPVLVRADGLGNLLPKDRARGPRSQRSFRERIRAKRSKLG